MSFIFLLAQENEPKEGHPKKVSGRSARPASGKPAKLGALAPQTVPAF